MKLIYKYIIALAIISIATTSCQKVIDIDLNSSDPKLVIEGFVNDVDDTAIVRLNYSVNFDEDNIFPPAEGALVKIVDSDGIETTLSETVTVEGTPTTITTTPGLYSAPLLGEVGKTYTLYVTDRGVTYTATSHLSAPIPLDSIYVSSTGGFNPPELSSYFMSCEFKDPAGEPNYYRFKQFVNGAENNYIFAGNDNLQDGQTIKASLFGSEDGFENGDTITIKMQMIDEGACDYLMSLSQLTQDGGGSAVPTNPRSNIKGGALGYFSAYSQVSDTLIVDLSIVSE